MVLTIYVVMFFIKQQLTMRQILKDHFYGTTLKKYFWLKNVAFAGDKDNIQLASQTTFFD